MVTLKKLNRDTLKKLIKEEVEKILSGEKDTSLNQELFDRLKHYKISDLKQELEDNYVSLSRRDEIVRFFKKYLGEGPYYVINGNLAKDVNLKVKLEYVKDVDYYDKRWGPVRMSRNFQCGTSNSAYSLKFGYGKIGENGPNFPIIMQQVNPKTSFELNYIVDYTKFYVNEEFLNDYLN